MTSKILGRRLDEIQEYFLSQVGSVERICQIPISTQELEYLAEKINLMMHDKEVETAVMDYKFTLVVYLIHTICTEEAIEERLNIMLEKIPQYYQKECINLCMEVFEEYGFLTDYERTGNIREEVIKLLAIHSDMEERPLEVRMNIA